MDVVVLVEAAMTYVPIEEIRRRLEELGCGPRGPEHKFTARCPVHEDKRPSLSVSVGEDGTILLKCFAMCSTEEIATKIGVSMADLFRDRQRAVDVATYSYVDEQGKGLFDVVRRSDKSFVARKTNGAYGVKDVRRVPYRLPKVLEAAQAGDVVYVVEGEKDVLAIEKAGAVATTNPFGAGKWRGEYAEHLRGAHVIVVRDRDDPGRAHAAEVMRSLMAKGIEEFELREAKAGNDVSDHLAAGLGLGELAVVETRNRTRTGDPSPPGGAVERLEQARVDLVELLRGGLPERPKVPGSPIWHRGKRHLFASAAKSGKSLFALVHAIDVACAGGTVMILDRENGTDEYARRVKSICDARPEAEAAVAKGLRYYGWPTLKFADALDESFIAHVKEADVVIFDASRPWLSAFGLKEDLSDDYAQFMSGLVDPMAKAGLAVVVLDNTGHDEQGRARGSSAKGDLHDLTFNVRTVKKFAVEYTGALVITPQLTRFDPGGPWRMSLGGGVYSSPKTVVDEGPERDLKRLALVEELLAGQGPQSRSWIGDALGKAGMGWRHDALGSALAAWAADSTTAIEAVKEDGRGDRYMVRGAS